MQNLCAPKLIQYPGYKKRFPERKLKDSWAEGDLKKVNDSERGATSFAWTKAKTNHIRFLSEFWNLNRHLKRNTYPTPKILGILLNLEDFQYNTSIDLNMDYYQIRLREQASKLYTIIRTWGKYRYKRLPMGVSNSPDIFQEKMNKMFRGFDLSKRTSINC